MYTLTRQSIIRSRLIISRPVISTLNQSRVQQPCQHLHVSSSYWIQDRFNERSNTSTFGEKQSQSSLEREENLGENRQNPVRSEESTGYTATRSDAQGVFNTDDSIPPISAHEPSTVSSEDATENIQPWNSARSSSSREPAAAASNTGSTLNEVKQFAENVIEKTKNLFGADRTKPQTHRVAEDSTFPPRRSVSQFTKAKEEIKGAYQDAKSAVKQAASAAAADASKNYNKTAADVNAQSAMGSVKQAVSDAYSAAKESVSDMKQNFNAATDNAADRAAESVQENVGEMKQKASQVKNQASAKASEAAGAIKKGAHEVKEKASDMARNASATINQAAEDVREEIRPVQSDYRTDRPTGKSPSGSVRTDEPVTPVQGTSRSDTPGRF